MMKRTVFMDWIWSQRNFKHVYAIHVPKHGRLRIIIGCKLNLFTHTHRWLWCINDVRMLFTLLPIGMWLTFRQDGVFTRKYCWWLKCIYQKVSVTRFNLILCVVSCEHEKCMSYHLKWVHWRRMFKDHGRKTNTKIQTWKLSSSRGQAEDFNNCLPKCTGSVSTTISYLFLLTVLSICRKINHLSFDMIAAHRAQCDQDKTNFEARANGTHVSPASDLSFIEILS